MHKNRPQVIIHASRLYTGEKIRQKDGRYLKSEDLDSIEDGAIVYSTFPRKILWVGKTKDLEKKYKKIIPLNLKGKKAILPGFIDCHTHLVFAGDRAQEFRERCEGATYQEITKKGGGILSTVRATRAASAELLEKLAIPRIKESMNYGVRTLEIKSGYGLDFDTEIKILKVIERLRKKFPEITLVSTFLGAHAFPEGVERTQYLSEIINKMLPTVAQKKWAEACDVFIDKGYFTLEEGRKILSQAKRLGLQIKLHGDELACTHSAELAAELGALSVDHLLKVSNEGISALARSNTVAVLLPATAFYLKTPQAPARKLLDQGVPVALATDFNPGTSMTLNLPAVMTLAALYLQMNCAEIFGAVTYSAAKALGLEKQKGVLKPGFDADITLLPFSSFEEAYYRFAWSPP